MLSERVVEWTRQWKQEGLLEGMEKGREEGREEGSLQTRQATARNLLAEGFATDLIARVTDLSVAEVEAMRLP